MKHLHSFFLLLFCSALFFTPLFAQDSGSTTTTAKTKTTVTHNADGSTTTTTTNPDGSTTAITTGKPDGTRIVDTAKIGGPWTTTTDYPDGSSIEYINNADGSSVKIVENTDGTWTKTATSASGKITTTSGGSGSSSGAPSSTPNPGSSPGATPTGSPTPTPTPTPGPSTTPLVPPFKIDQVAVWMGAQGDATNMFLIGASCITVDQWAAFLNAVAKYSDNHGLYYASMADKAQSKTDFHGNVITPKLGQIIRTLSADGKENTYTVANRDDNAQVAGAPDMVNKDLPVTYVDLFDAARFCNWLHHGEPVVQSSSENPDDYTEGGAYLIDPGFNAQFNRYEEARTCITQLSTALWRIPSYYAYNGVHHVSGKNQSVPDFTQPGDEFSSQQVPFNEINGFFDNYNNIWLWQYAHYELTSTHNCTCFSALKLYNCNPAFYGNYYVVKSPSDEKKDFAEPFTINTATHERSVIKDADTSFRVMPVGQAPSQ